MLRLLLCYALLCCDSRNTIGNLPRKRPGLVAARVTEASKSKKANRRLGKGLDPVIVVG
jgi:hypothetical protein